MQPHLASADDPFAAAAAHFAETCSWLGDDAMDLAHGAIETHILLASREIARRLFQAHLDLRARHERGAPRPAQVHPDAEPRAQRCELDTIIRRVCVTRRAWQRKWEPTVRPLDAELDLPREVYSSVTPPSSRVAALGPLVQGDRLRRARSRVGVVRTQAPQHPVDPRPHCAVQSAVPTSGLRRRARHHRARRALLRAELDAAFFHLYGIARDDVDYIMETFPIVRRNDEKAHGEYRTKQLILEVYDAMAEAARTDRAYETRLDPPPADARVAHADDRSTNKGAG